MEARLFKLGTVPECTTAAWYADRERAPHLEQGPHQARLHTAAEFSVDALYAGAVDPGRRDLVDVGAGDGGLLSLLGDRLQRRNAFNVRAWGYDLQQTNVTGARERGVDVRLGDAVEGDIEWGDVTVATEVLEHLLDPHAFLRKVARNSGWLVASSPYNETAESHYAFHLWAWDQMGYRALVQQAGFEVLQHDSNPDGFQVLLARL